MKALLMNSAKLAKQGRLISPRKLLNEAGEGLVNTADPFRLA